MIEIRQVFNRPKMLVPGEPLTKQEAIYRRLKDEIMLVRIMPGQRLVIDDLAEKLGTSSIPVREALRQLESDGLVDIRPHSGATVAPITLLNVEETFTILEGMEGMAARRVSLERNESLLVGLNQLMGWLDKAVEEKNLSDWSGLNMDLHLDLAAATGMPWLYEITERAIQNWDRIRRYFFPEGVPHRLLEAQKEHYALLAAIQNNQPDEAERIIREHNRHALDYYRNLIQKVAGA